MLSKRLGQFSRALIYSEVILIFLVSVIVSVIRLDESLYEIFFTFPGQPKILIFPLIWYVLLYLNDGWDKSKILNSTKFFTDILDASFKSLIAFSAIAFLAKYPISRIWVIYNVVAITLALLLLRFGLRKVILIEAPSPSELKYLYIGNKQNLELFRREFASLFGFTPKFEVFAPPGSEGSEKWFQKYKSKIEKDVFGVVISYAAIGDAQLLKEMSNYDRDKVVDLILISRIAPVISRFEVLENPTLIRIKQSSLFVSGAFLKRLTDLLGSLLGLIVLIPIFVLTAIAVKLSSPGPILFTDRRIGKNGVTFTFPKFRSMYKGSEFKRSDFIGRPDSEIALRYQKDPRITPVGRFLRRWSIDELPQLWCVFIGTMSLVGPRPILVEERDLVDPLHTERFMAKPGLTGLWQVTGRKEVAWEDRMLRDLAYIENWSLWRDLVYIAKTFRAVLRGDGAY